MKYIIQVEIDPETGAEMEETPEKIQEIISKWQAHNPIGFYFSLTRRAMTIILDAPNEDTFFEALHATWLLTHDYPDVSPVADVEEFGGIMQRLGLSG